MSKKIAFIFPGQGAQFVGMGRDFYQNFPKAAAVFDQADEILGTSFSRLIFEGPSDELTKTSNSQLAIFITSMAILEVIKETYPDLVPAFCAGLSLGEYTALVAAGVLTFEDGLALVKARGTFMQQACESHPGTMRVVLGLALEKIPEMPEVWIANLNAPGQVVIAGTKEGIEKAEPVLKEAGAKRVLPLDVSGAFHSGLMAPAKESLTPLINAVPMEEPKATLVMNVTGHKETDSEKIRANMAAQVTGTTFWQKGIESINDQVDLFIEMGPGKTLAGMNKKIGTNAPTLSVEKIEDLASLEERLHANA